MRGQLPIRSMMKILAPVKNLLVGVELIEA